MPIDYDILDECGSDEGAWRELFTAKAPTDRKRQSMTAKEIKEAEKRVDTRKRFENKIASILQEQIIFSLSNQQFYSAVDLAWDSNPITKYTIPLLMYAQGRIDVRQAAKELTTATNGDKYVKKNSEGQITGIDVPKYCEMNINVVRSIINRRTAAQCNKYNNLFPHFKYESRSTGEIGKLRAEACSQRMDVMADQFDYTATEEQEIRDTFLYGHSVSFPRCAWEREVQWEKELVADEFRTQKPIRKRARVVKEGVAWVRCHPSRLIKDINYPLTSLNSDIGCEFVGFWDVSRYGDIANNPVYFNRSTIGYSTDTAGWFTTYSSYFNQYYDRITPPALPENPAAPNDRRNSVGIYTGEMNDSSVFLTDLFMKVIPKSWGVGSYPYPIWLHLKVAGDATVVFCEVMPSSPAAVYALNEKDDRLLNVSMAHELMSYQDQLTNLFTQLLEAIRADLFAIAVINTDIFPPTPDGKRVLEEFRATMRGNNFYASTSILEASFQKLADIGISMTADNIFKIVRSAPNTKITEIFGAIARVVEMAEKMMSLSPQEQGQPAPREITAEETRLIGGTTESVYSFIGAAIDRARAAKKRICYESLVAKGEDNVYLPVLNRYPPNLITKAGFKIVEDGEDVTGQLVFRNITGSKYALVHDYIFTARDGADRSDNAKSAMTLVQLVTAFGTFPPEVTKAIFSHIGKEKLFELFNEIFRMSGASMDLRLQPKPGEDDSLLIEDDQQIMGIIQQLGNAVQKNTQDIAQILAALQGGQQQPQQPSSSSMAA